MYYSDSQQKKWNYYKHLNRGNLLEKIGYINRRRTEKPNKGKGNPDIKHGRHSQPSLGWRDKARGGINRSQTSACHSEETGATDETQQRSDSTRGIRAIWIIPWFLHSFCAFTAWTQPEVNNLGVWEIHPTEPVPCNIEQRPGIHPRRNTCPHSYLICFLPWCKILGPQCYSFRALKTLLHCHPASNAVDKKSDSSISCGLPSLVPIKPPEK